MKAQTLPPIDKLDPGLTQPEAALDPANVAPIAGQRPAFYVSTPAYRLPFADAGPEHLTVELSALSKTQRCSDRAARISDDVLEQWVLVATHGHLAPAALDRYSTGSGT